MECPKCNHYDALINCRIADELALRKLYNYGYGESVDLVCTKCDYKFKVKRVVTHEIIEVDDEVSV